MLEENNSLDLYSDLKKPMKTGTKLKELFQNFKALNVKKCEKHAFRALPEWNNPEQCRFLIPNEHNPDPKLYAYSVAALETTLPPERILIKNPYFYAFG